MASENFEQWSAEAGLNQKTIDYLTKQDLADLKALQAIECDSVIPVLKLSIGQSALLRKAVKKLQIGDSPLVSNNQEDNAVGPDPEGGQDPQSENTPTLGELRNDAEIQSLLHQMQGAGLPLSNLLQQNQSKHNAGGLVHATGFDPVVYLRPRSMSKFHDIVDFVYPQEGEFEETISNRDGIEIVMRNVRNHRKPQLNSVSVTQWNIAYMAILYQLLTEGSLAHTQVPDYLAYSTKILELSFQYEWESVLRYDRDYRAKQACHGFRWGVDPPHLSLAILIPRQRQGKPFNKNSTKINPKNAKRALTKAGKEICLSFNSRNGCRWGAGCKYQHVCSEKDCEQAHPQFQHNS